MRDTYLQNLTQKLSVTDKKKLNMFYKACLLASQHSFLESYLEGTKITFCLLEGVVSYDLDTQTGKFKPSKNLLKLIKNVEEKETSVILEKEINRFSTLLQKIYYDLNEENKNAEIGRPNFIQSNK